jgi:hypothetical protein
MTAPRAHRIAVLAALTAGMVIAVGVPMGDRWRACREPTSEACVWGKALFPVSLAMFAVVGAAAAVLVFLAVRAWQRRPPRRG